MTERKRKIQKTNNDSTETKAAEAPSAPQNACPIQPPPRHGSVNFYTSLLEQRRLRYKLQNWLNYHRVHDHSDAEGQCWMCCLYKDFSCGDVNLFEVLYLYRLEKKSKTCCNRKKQELIERGQHVPAVRCVFKKNGYCSMHNQDWNELKD